MKIRRVLCLSFVLVIPQMAFAKLPMPPESLAKIEGTLDFCSEVNPKGAPTYKELKKTLVADASEQELAGVRNSAEYKNAYQDITDQLAKVPQETAIKACKAYPEVYK